MSTEADKALAVAKEGLERFGWGENTPLGMLARSYLDLQAKLTASEAAREALTDLCRETLSMVDEAARNGRTTQEAIDWVAPRLEERIYLAAATWEPVEPSALRAPGLYRKRGLVEVRPWQPGDDMTRVSLSPADKDAGSPKAGDVIARDPSNPVDQWLIAAQYFADNYEPSEPVGQEVSDEELIRIAATARATIRQIGGTREQDRAERRALYEAGRASEAAARVEWLKSDAARVELNAVTELGTVKAELERVRAELAEARGWQEADRLNREMHPNGRCECAGEGACLWCRNDAAQTELAKLREELQHRLSENHTLRAHVNLVSEGREEPSDEALEQMLSEVWHADSNDLTDWLSVARAAKSALLGVRRAADDPTLDGTDGAHPAWWRGVDHGVDQACDALEACLDSDEQVGTFACPRLEALAQRVTRLGGRRVAVTREQIADAIEASVGDEGWREAYLTAADAVLRLLSAEAKAGQDSGRDLGTARVVYRGKIEPREVEAPDLAETDNEPPSPLPSSLPKGTVRTVNGHREESPTDLILMRNSFGEPRYEGRWHPALTRPENIDWSHYRAQRRAAVSEIRARRRHPDEAPTHGEDARRTAMLFCFAYEATTPDGHMEIGFRHEDGVWRAADHESEDIPHALVRWWVPLHEILTFDKVGPSQPDSASAWLKRTVEELTTARPVEVTEDEDGMLKVTAPGLDPLYFGEYLRTRDAQGVARVLRGNDWPLRRSCIPDPTPKAPEHAVLVPERLDQLTARVEQLEDQVRGMAEGTASEFRRVDATLRAHSERIEAGVDALKDTERDLDRRVDAQSKRLDELELHVRVHRRLLQLVFDRVGALPTFTEYWERIEREERERGA